MRAGEYLSAMEYPGRLIVAGTEESGKPFLAYAITGRSNNSRNRIMTEECGFIRTKAYDETLVEDPSLIIYTALRKAGDYLIAANGDHSDTIASALREGKGIDDALVCRTYEPDGPIYTPRIAAVIKPDSSTAIAMIRRKDDGKPERLLWHYGKENGICHLISTYCGSADEPGAYTGNPLRLTSSDAFLLLDELWDALSPEYRVSAYAVRGNEIRLINRLGGNDGTA